VEPASTEPRSITEFLTDGSLAAFCSELARFSGLPIELHDDQGRRIVRRIAEGGPGWALAKAEVSEDEGSTRVPLMLGGREIGALVLGAGELPEEAAGNEDRRTQLIATLKLLAQTATDICQHEAELRHALREVGALSRMASLLVRAAGPERVLEVVLELAMDVLGMDAGSVVLFRTDDDGPASSELEEDLLLKASKNLSKEWLESNLPLSKDRLFDKLAAQGRLVVVEDIANDDRVLIPDRAANEGLGSALHAGLMFKNRPLGVVRLYARTPRRFEENEKRLLASLAHQAAVALEQSRLMKFEQEEARIQRQLQLAADVQRRMLPRGTPTNPRLDFAARYVPSFELGGDFYDFVELHGHVGVVVGDVVGKGIAAALFMAAVRASLRAHAQQVYDLDEVVARVNQALCRDTADNEFASLWYGVIDPAKLRLTYCSAGHEPTIIVRVPKHRPPTHADIDELTVGGMVVGIDPSQRYQRAVFDMQARDVLVAYTDGVTDAINFDGQRFGRKRIKESILRVLTENPQATAAEIVERLLWEIRQFAGLSPRQDDRSLVVVRVLE
jgi:sigma-B regulation protein RsbU (phosphoserine phosphatase)